VNRVKKTFATLASANGRIAAPWSWNLTWMLNSQVDGHSLSEELMMKLIRSIALVGCLPAVAMALPDVMLDAELNGLDIRTWVEEAAAEPDALSPENFHHVRLTNNHDSTVHCTMEPEPAEDAWTFFPEATIKPGEEVLLPVGGDYTTDIIRAKLICEDTELL
jgi:hypothetical protein